METKHFMGMTLIILGGTCPHSTADISHYQNDHNKSSNIKDAFVDKLLPV